MVFAAILSVVLASPIVECPRWINIAPLAEDHVDEMAQDQRWLYDNTIIDSTAFMATLVPEGEPIFDKAAVYAERFNKIRDKLKNANGKVGILFQATMGHGWVPDSPAALPKIVAADGTSPYIFCPLDKGFLAYIRAQAAQLAECRPDFFMVDDDTRLITGREGCYCPMHIAEMNRLMGREFTRESLAKAVREEKEVADVYCELLGETIAGLVRVIREEFDKVDPMIPGSFCCCVWDAHHAGRMAEILKGAGQTSPVVRLNNGRYLNDSARGIPSWMHLTGMELATIPENVVVLDEPDCCPQNLYSTSAVDLNAHIALSIIEGCRGAKIWITRLSDFEPKSGTKYREVLAANRGLYEELVNLDATWEGLVNPYPSTPIAQPYGYWATRSWGDAVLAKFAIPYVNSKTASGIVAMNGEDVRILSDDDLRRILGGRVLLDGEAARVLTARGFSNEIGSQAKVWEGPIASFETFYGGKINSMIRAAKLENVDSTARKLSTLHHRSAELASESTEVGVGSYIYENELGGHILVFAADLPQYLSLDAFSFYNETRKRQLMGALKELSGGELEFPYYAGDAEVLLKWGHSQDGKRLLFACDLGHDSLKELPLVLPARMTIDAIKRLMPDGNWESVRFMQSGDETVIKSSLDFFEPVMFEIITK